MFAARAVQRREKREKKRGRGREREREARRDEILSNVSDHDSRHTHVSLVAF